MTSEPIGATVRPSHLCSVDEHTLDLTLLCVLLRRVRQPLNALILKRPSGSQTHICAPAPPPQLCREARRVKIGSANWRLNFFFLVGHCSFRVQDVRHGDFGGLSDRGLFPACTRRDANRRGSTWEPKLDRAMPWRVRCRGFAGVGDA